VERLTYRERLRRVNPLVADALLALAVFTISILGGSSFNITALGGEGFHYRFNGPWQSALLVAAACLPLVWRRRAPVAALAAAAAVAVAYELLDYQDGLPGIAAAVAAYSAAAHTNRRVVLTKVLPLTLLAPSAIVLHSEAGRGRNEILLILIFEVLLPLLFGRIAFNRRRRMALDLQRAARDAVGEERARIARELHDVVAHAMGVMVVQAGAARLVLNRDPAGATASLRRIEDTGRTGLDEMRRLLGVLEARDGAAARAPQPGLERLDELIETVRGTGLAVEAMVEGTPRDLPPGVDLTAYRVVQEALTNALKHAGPAHARVLLRYQEEALEVEVADDGRGPLPDGAQIPGRGLIGMRERVGLFGGSLETAERAGGGFVVRARIPLTDST
jgi:signal transduction histidine kinase